MDHINPSIRERLKSDQFEVKALSYYVKGIIEDSDYFVLSEAITLLESEKKEHRRLSLDILSNCFKADRKTIRIGITGSPGVGKSSFIDSIVTELVNSGNKVAILTVDPSSTISKGSILGDKTRMDELVKDQRIFIRPSPSNRHLGGLNFHTFEAITLCEAAGIDTIFIETVGVGQSEVEVSKHTDATILLVLPGGGDSLQGIKRGITEEADLIIVNKADGDAASMAKHSVKEYREARHYYKDEKKVDVLTYSSINPTNKDVVINAIKGIFRKKQTELLEIRKSQNTKWLKTNIESFILKEIRAKLLDQKMEKKISEELRSESPFNALINICERLLIDIRLK